MGANAQTSVWSFTAGNVLTAAQLNDTARTGVPVFATTTDRDGAFGGTGEKTLAEGQMCYIEAAPKRFQVYNGTAWIDYDAAWTSFTPTWTNLTIGNGTQTFRYLRLGKVIFVYGIVTFGSTTSVTGSISFANPILAVNRAGAVTGSTYFTDSGTGTFIGLTSETGVGTQAVQALNAAGTYLANVNTSATVPFTWAVNDNLVINLSYEVS